MRKPYFVVLLALAQISGASEIQNFSLRIQQAQESLLKYGSNAQVLGEYDELISAISKSVDSVPKHSLAQVHYQRSLIEISMGKTALAIADLVESLEIDSSFRPASNKLLETWLERGQFSEIRDKFDEKSHSDIYGRMNEWEDAFKQVSATLNSSKPSKDALLQCIELIDNTLLHITRSNAAVYELRLDASKKLALVAFRARETVDFDAIVKDYAKLIRLSPQRSLDQYSEFSQYLLFTRGSFEEGWNFVKNGLRIDNDHKQCGALSKIYNRLQNVLRPLEEYFVLHDYLYPATEQMSDLPDEKLHAFNVDFKEVYEYLNGPVNLSKRDMKDLPSSVKSVYDFLVFRASEFTLTEFGDKKMGLSLPLIEVLKKFLCEASVRAKGNKKQFCGLVDDSKQPFLPKHVADIDAMLKRRDYNGAKQTLSAYNKNVQKTNLFQKRWAPIQEMETRQQQQRHQQQQQQHRQQQQHQQQYHQQQQQQQQESKFDRSKDYYKILDVSKDADEKTLKKAYRMQTLKFHPDKYKGTDLSEKEIESKMQDINQAYEILSDPDTRADYDRGPQEQQRGGFQSNHGAQNVQFNFNPEQFMHQFGGGGFKFNFG